MANPEHLKILKLGVKVWNKWLLNNHGVKPNLSNANLQGAKLHGANLRRADFSGANLYMADLSSTNLYRANLSETFPGHANFCDADLRSADLCSAKLCFANFSGANLSGAILRDTSFSGGDLREANLNGANLDNANFYDLYMRTTIVGDVDLGQVRHLESVRHMGPSFVGIDTIYKSRGNIPEVFLRGCGVPEDFITYMRSLTVQPIQFYSCFISYSSKDQAFAERLYADLQGKGVRCWFAPEDLKIGDRLRPRIDESIRLHDKLLLVLSETSVTSQWVEQEVETALARERESGNTVLFPIRLDNNVMEIQGGWPALIRNTRNIGDFTHWKEHDSYQKAFDRLLRDLKAGT
jgi:hypothetical protein